MADRTALEIELALMRDVDAGRVVDDADFTPCLLVDGEPVRVADLVWALERARLVEQPFTSRTWQLTRAGRQALKDADR